MEFGWFDIVGNGGVILIIIAYFLLQARLIDSISVAYSTLNALGAGMVLISLTEAFNLAAFVLEFFWVLISLWGLATALRIRRAHQTKS